MPRPRLLAFMLLFSFQFAIAQKEASIWYFGKNAGLDFNSGSPTLLMDGQLDTDEGVATICDASGQLLFYTEGTMVWNRQHTIMPNGKDLLGSFSSSQSSVIVPKINDPGKYYVFTVAQLGITDGFNYSVINMALDGGKGDVETKNVHLQSPVCEKLTAVKHCNGRDIWVIVHGFNTATFHAYLVTPAGVSTSPVVSTAGRLVPNSNEEFTIGCMKVSPNGKKVAVAHMHLGVDLLDFDNSTGIISKGNSLFLPAEPYGSYRGAYGVEFSPNSKYLYVSGDYTSGQEISYLLQYNVNLSTHSLIQASKKVIYQQQAAWYANNFGTLQIGPDGKMYMAEFGQPYISVINYPDLQGAACQFVHAGISTWKIGTGGGLSEYGLPSFIQSYFKNTFTFRGACSGSTLKFDYEKSADELSVKWDFGDPASGLSNFSTFDSTQHTFSAEGAYSVKLIRFTACGNDTVLKTVNAGAGQVNLGNDTIFCGLSQYNILPQLTGANNSFLWQDGSLGSGFTANKTGLYWVEVTNKVNGCSKRDSTYLTFKPNPVFSLGNDQAKCDGDVVRLTVNQPATFLWSDGSRNNALQISQPGTYWLDVTLDGCTLRDSINISYDSYPVLDLGKDTILCEGTSLLLDAQNPGTHFRWQDNSSGQTLRVNTAGTYWVIANNNVCISTDTIKVGFLRKPTFTLGADTAICLDANMMLLPKIQQGTDFMYAWSTGSAEPSILVEQAGIYSLMLTNQCGVWSDAINISKDLCKLNVPSAFTPNHDGKNDTFRALFAGKMVSFELTVYNRWGEVIFKSRDIHYGWDGNYKGQLQDSGIFPWIIRYKPLNEPNEKLIKGKVILIK